MEDTILNVFLKVWKNYNMDLLGTEGVYNSNMKNKYQYIPYILKHKSPSQQNFDMCYCITKLKKKHFFVSNNYVSKKI